MTDKTAHWTDVLSVEAICSFFLLHFARLFVTFSLGEVTSVRKSSNNIWLFAHLFVTLHAVRKKDVKR
jgi:hypothetical protein